MQGKPSGMTSPATGEHELLEIEVCGVKVDYCPATGGVWFDQYELDHFDEAHEPADALLELPYDPSIEVDHRARRPSPRHPDVVMLRHFFGPEQAVEVDVCPQCGGIWLDRGELDKIRELYPNAEDRERAASAAAAQWFNESFAEERSENARIRQRADTFGHLLRFLRPSRLFRG